MLKQALLAGEVLVLGWLLATEDLSPVGLMLLAIAGVLLLVATTLRGWPFGAVLLLAVTSAMPRFAGTMLGLHVRPEHVSIGLIVLLVLLKADRGGLLFRFDLKIFDYFLLAYVVLNFFSSAVTSPDPHMTLRWAAMNALAVTPYFLLRILVPTEQTVYKAFLIVLWVGACESAYGIICFLSNHIFNTTFGIEAQQYGSTSGTYATQYEANLFGSYAACCAIMFLIFCLLSEETRLSRYWLGFVITTVGALISLSRAVLLTFPIAVLLVVLLALRKGQFQLRKFVPLACTIALLSLAIGPLVLGFVRERFSTIDVTEISSDETTAIRLVSVGLALQNIERHPVLGSGTASFQLLVDWDDYLPGYKDTKPEAGAWIGNTPLRILHDTGAIGLFVFLAFMWQLIIAFRRVVKNTTGTTAAILIALFAGTTFYAITFQATEATMLAFTWVHIGLLAAAIAIIQREQSSTLESR